MVDHRAEIGFVLREGEDWVGKSLQILNYGCCDVWKSVVMGKKGHQLSMVGNPTETKIP
jgi:hypothetical protein